MCRAEPPPVPGWRLATLDARVAAPRAAGFVEVTAHDVTRDAVRNAPEYVAPDDAPPADDVGVGSYRSGVSRAYEERLYQHYGRPGYWARDPRFWLLMPPAA